MKTKEEPTVRCGFCERRVTAAQARQHWTWSRCNLRPVSQR